MRRRHLLVLAVAVLVVLAAVFVQVRKGNRTGQQAEAESKGMASGGREQCRHKCAVLHKGFVYRARRNAAAEYCGCV
jgi:hypothetical protein